MARYLDENFWLETLGKPNWYILLADDFARLEKLAEQHKDEPDHKKIKREAYEIVEKAITDGRIPFASMDENMDKDRQPIDTIVVHHTKNPPGMTLERLNAMHLLRIYGKYFANPTDPNEQHLRSSPIWSGHFYNNKQVFWGYHWLVLENGVVEQILADSYIGWHAGNWDINTRSVGICVDDDLSEKEPSETVILSLASLIRDNYSAISSDNILGHCEVNAKTECPGRLFRESWKQKILDKFDKQQM
jgi:hypothetical protein